MSLVTLALAEDLIAFCDAFRIGLFDWQREDFRRALKRDNGRFIYRIVGISVRRGYGKMHGTAASGVWRLISGKTTARTCSMNGGNELFSVCACGRDRRRNRRKTIRADDPVLVRRVRVRPVRHR